MTKYCLPTRSYTVIDAINRYAASTGSPRCASLTAHSDYNGHHVTVVFNTYRNYWITEYFWAGRNVLCRGSLEDCLRAAKREYDRGAKGASVTVETLTADDEDTCKREGFVEESTVESWFTTLHQEVPGAFELERHGLAPAVGLLANSATIEEYKAKLDAFFEARRAARKTA